MRNEDFFTAVKLMAAEKDIPVETLYENIANALVVAEKRKYGGISDFVFCDIAPDKQELRMYLHKEVVDEVTNPDTQLALEAALSIDPNASVGSFVDVPLDTHDFGRIDAQTAKHVIRQGIRDAERSKTLNEFKAHNQEIMTSRVQNVDERTGNATIEINNHAVLLPRGEQIPGEVLEDGDIIKVYIVEVREGDRGAKAMISRTHPGLVRRLFETEVPEIQDGTVEIKEVAREAGSRTKIAVSSSEENVDAVGACIGPRGTRVGDVGDMLDGEKIDFVPYSEDPSEFIAAALAPANVINVEILDEEEHSCRVIVPDNQLSLAIGNKGQNARLAAKLTGWKIDINPESGIIHPKKEVETADEEFMDDEFSDDEEIFE